MPGTSISIDHAADATRTGDIWVFRGSSAADRAIRGMTNSPVNHVGMSVVIDDLPALMWHAELGRSLVDQWSGTRQRGVQLHDLRDAVGVWVNRYDQRAWLRQLQPTITTALEDAVLRCIAQHDGTSFPSTARLVGQWARSRIPLRRDPDDRQGLRTAYCAEVVALTYQAMGLLPARRRAQWYDPGRFWSGDDLHLQLGYALGEEITVVLPAPTDEGHPVERRHPRRRGPLTRAMRRVTRTTRGSG